jgi:hypothetical protein
VAIPLAGFTQGGSPTSFLCISTQSTGFAYDNARHEWSVARFEAGEKFIVRRVTRDTIAEFEGGIQVPLASAWAVWRFGNDKAPAAQCKNDFAENGMLFCEGQPQLQFQFSRKTQRFILGTVYGYVFGAVSAPANFGAPPINWPEGSSTPFIAIGTCSAI